MTYRTIVAAIVAACLSLIPGQPSRAADYPDHPIKLILPFTAGSPNSVLARLVAPEVAERLGQPIVVEYHPGGGTTIGTKSVIGATPDGYTLLFNNTPTLLIAPAADAIIKYDPLKDVVPVALFATSSNVIVIQPSLPAKNVKEFVAYAKAHPGQLNFGFGKGTQPNLIGEMFKMATGTKITDIPYKGGANAITDMLGGRIQMNIGTLSTLRPLHLTGKVRAIAVTSEERSALLPDVPTMAESGYPSVTSESHYGVFAPPGVSPQIVAKLNKAVNEALKSDKLKANLEKLGFTPRIVTPQEFSALVEAEYKKWVPVVKATGFKM
jgi:tripartite-type tricarboxylate transporter receptor subunit TctC